MSRGTDSVPEPWKVRLVERTGAVLFVGGAATFIIGTICGIVVGALWGVVFFPMGLSGLLALPTGWRLMMHPEDPRSIVVEALVNVLTRWHG